MNIISVTQLNRYVASILDADKNLRSLHVTGEISSFKRYHTGHLYFNLKDKNSSIACVMFHGRTGQLNFEPRDGMKVVVGARASLYDRDGKFQLYVESMSLEGIGQLFMAYEKLKKDLESEGLFDPARKRPLPFLPKRIGVVTSRSGAVIQDIINVLRRRFPGFDLLLIPTKVQGDGAASEMVEALKVFNKRGEVDVIIIARGGGSFEDLWCFNDEGLARAVYDSKIPVISAVGHETDFTICDFVADLRAPTPSAAAELVLPDKGALLDRLRQNQNNLKLMLSRRLEYSKLRLHNATSRAVLENPLLLTNPHKETLGQVRDKFKLLMDRQVKEKLSSFEKLLAILESLNPLALISRGYSVVELEDKGTSKRVYRARDLSPGNRLTIKFSDGRASGIIEDVKLK